MSNERENLSEAFYQDLLLLQAPVEKKKNHQLSTTEL